MVTNGIYQIVRDAIKKTEQHRGRLYEVGQESHYMALAAVMALKEAGYSISKTTDA